MGLEGESILDHPHNYYNNPPSNAWEITVTNSIGLCLAFIAVALRCYTKLRITKGPGWEDYTSALALAGFIAWFALYLVQKDHFGGGRHSWDLPIEYYNGYLTTSAVAGYLYVFCIMLAKVSLLLFLYRIFNVDFKFRVASWIIGFVVVVWSLVTLCLMIFSCHPIKANWDVMLLADPKTHCYPKVYNVINIHGYCNIITDFALLILPLPLVWNLQMTLRKKLSVATIFATGAFVCAVAIVRQYIVYNTNKAGDNWEGTRNTIWMSIEFSLSIVIACLPALAPFFKQHSIFSGIIPSNIRSKFSNRSAIQRRAGSEKLSGPNQDMERGAVGGQQSSYTAWQTPRAWNGAQHSSLDDFDGISRGSETSLQPVLPTHRELRHKD